MRIDAIGLLVNDMTTMVGFYRDVMGMKTNWKEEPNAELYAGCVRFIMFERKDLEDMASQQFSCPSGVNGTFKLSFDFDKYEEIDQEYERLTAAGAISVLPPTTDSSGKRTSYVTDPEGNLIEISSFG